MLVYRQAVPSIGAQSQGVVRLDGYPLKSPLLWSSETPNMYKLLVTLVRSLLLSRFSFTPKFQKTFSFISLGQWKGC